MGLLTILRPLFVAPAQTTVDGAALPPPPPPSHEEVPSIQTGETPDRDSEKPATPVFLTAQSLLSFPGAAIGINILWHLVAVLDKGLAQRAIVPVVLGFIIGTLIYVISYSSGLSRKDKMVGLVIAFINSAWLGLNALGVDIVKPPTP